MKCAAMLCKREINERGSKICPHCRGKYPKKHRGSQERAAFEGWRHRRGIVIVPPGRAPWLPELSNTIRIEEGKDAGNRL